MKVKELIRKLSKMEADEEVRFAFIESEDSDGCMNTYAIHDVEMINKTISSLGIKFCLITTNEKCIEDI